MNSCSITIQGSHFGDSVYKYIKESSLGLNLPIKLLHVTFLLIKLSNEFSYLTVFEKSSPFSPENKVKIQSDFVLFTLLVNRELLNQY